MAFGLPRMCGGSAPFGPSELEVLVDDWSGRDDRRRIHVKATAATKTAAMISNGRERFTYFTQ